MLYFPRISYKKFEESKVRTKMKNLLVSLVSNVYQVDW